MCDRTASFFDRVPELSGKCAKLSDTLLGYDSIAVAFSGGVDSTFLCWFVKELMGKRLSPIMVTSALQVAGERESAAASSDSLGFEILHIPFDPFSSPSVVANSPLRCYHCKSEIMGLIVSKAHDLKCAVTIEASHLSDSTSYRPGRKALRELGVLSPLEHAGFTKDDIRRLAFFAGLPNWNKEPQSCLATRVRYGTPLTRDLLSRIDRAERALRELGCKSVRVRSEGLSARIEVAPESFNILLDQRTRSSIADLFRQLGFERSSVDLEGYSSGSWDDDSLLDRNIKKEKTGKA